ncbi:hypothetical protein HDU76_013378 [Blyttiomyces sp. JEL0837]|nr:hypothetical protein HDU76_013378 [Blyttiomyces sp. JEL0837]
MDHTAAKKTTTIYTGTILQCATQLIDGSASLEVIDNGAIVVNPSGIITAIYQNAGEGFDKTPQPYLHIPIPSGQWLQPGFIDLHYHAPQLPLAGRCMSDPLETWLKTTIPLESKCVDKRYVTRLYEKVVKRTLKCGSTGVVYFGSVHEDGCLVLKDICEGLGQRAWIGKVCMDNKMSCGCSSTTTSKGSVNGTGCKCVDASVEESVEATRRFLERCKEGDRGLVTGVITPRFVPACSEGLLDGLGGLAKEFKVPVQTHAWESDWQVDYGIQNRGGKRDLELMDQHGLASTGTLILAHCVHANDSEIKAMAQRSIGVAHCPLSNAFFANGIMPCKEMLRAGVPVGLATDVGGAPSSSILDSARQAVISSRILQDGIGRERGGMAKPGCGVTAIDALWMATVGGGLALGFGNGNPGLRVGNAFDAIVVDTRVDGTNVEEDGVFDGLQELSLKERVEMFVMAGDDRNVRQVFVQGSCVVDKYSMN